MYLLLLQDSLSSHLLDLVIKHVVEVVVEVPDFSLPPGIVCVARIVNVATVQDGR